MASSFRQDEPGGQAAAPGHPCPVRCCPRRARAGQLMCGPCWALVPRPVRGAVWAAWRGGAGAGTPAHTAAISRAIAAAGARRQEGR